MYTIADLNKGDTAIIKDVSSIDIPIKLLEMGCTPGEKIEVVRRAPFGGPVAILVSSYVLSVRKEDALKIDVKLLKDE